MKNLKINALASVTVRVLNILSPLITGPYIARTLSKENISLFDASNTIAQLFIPFATFGIYTYGVRAISKVKNNIKKRNELFSELFFLSVISTLITSLIYYTYVTNFLDYKNNIQIYVYSILGLQILCQFLYIEWINEAFENYTFILYKTIVVRLTIFTLTFTLIKDADDVLPYVSIMTLAEILNMLISFIWIKKEVKFVKIKIKNLLKLLSPLFTILLLSNLNMLYIYLDRIFLTNSPVSTNISDYVVSYNIVMLITGVISGAISVNIPRLSYYWGENKIEDYTNLINKGSQFFLFLITPISFGLMILGTEATLIYGGDKFLSAGIVTSIFAIRALILALDNIIGIQILFVQGYEKKLALYIAIGGLSNLALNSLLFYNNLFSPEYYIMTTIVAEIIVVILYVQFIIRKNIMNLKNLLQNFLKYTIISSTFFVVSLIVEKFIPHSIIINKITILSIAIKIISCGLIYFLILYISKDKMLYDTIYFIKGKIKRLAK
ncbi:oligosaccharide flippase family protein [Gemella sp. zg-570]|uniref:oligosaccharide flippase family protein n=1 Tax=Gemella sp. zg-570 TaxID=2840371 RepID=UPI001C0C5A1E|nr:oligosaccharide flippase family protein [Gemella sp. zg-570]QWQ39044.1 oligosaccharide flippase family protein [Gemella sp. zg-570]